jgi:hypothetical protein
MIEKLVIHKGDYIYIRFKALIWHSNCLIKHQTILQSSIKLLEEIYINTFPTIPLVVSLRGVVDTERPFENFFSETVSVKKRPIIFIHNESFSDNIIQAILRVEKNKQPQFSSDPNELDVVKVSCTASEDLVVKGLISKIEKAEQEFLLKAIKDCHKPVNQRLLSTVVNANVEFDAAKIISEPNVFIWVCLFMADKITAFIKEKFHGDSFNPNSSNIKLLAVSLRASPFASAVSFLIDRGYDTIDHLGPKHKLFDIELIENFKKGIQYIYIGDFAVGGTEIKIAQAYAELLGCELNYAVVLSSLLEPEVFKENFTLIPLTRINDAVPNAEYKLTDTNV